MRSVAISGIIFQSPSEEERRTPRRGKAFLLAHAWLNGRLSEADLDICAWAVGQGHGIHAATVVRGALTGWKEWA